MNPAYVVAAGDLCLPEGLLQDVLRARCEGCLVSPVFPQPSGGTGFPILVLFLVLVFDQNVNLLSRVFQSYAERSECAGGEGVPMTEEP